MRTRMVLTFSHGDHLADIEMLQARDTRSTLAATRFHREARAAFSLMEVLLVLVLLVVIGTISVWSLKGTFRQQQLVRSGEKIQAEWARARVKAIKTGRVHVFYHAVSGQQYYTSAEASIDDPTPTEMLGTMNSMSGFGTSSASSSSSSSSDPLLSNVPAAVNQLPQFVSFVGADVQMDQRTVLQLSGLAPTNNGFGSSTAPAEASWGTPIYFFPDGTSSSALLVLRNDRQQAIAVTLRGLTGTSRLGRVQAENTILLQGGQR